MYPRQIIFIAVFSVFLFLLFLLGDTYLSYYLIGFYLIFTKFYFKDFRKKYSSNFIFLLFLLIAFFLISFFSAINGLNFPLSLSNLVYLLFFIINFIFIYSLPKSFLKKEILAFFLLEISAMMCLFNVFFLIFPQLGVLLPGRNLIFPSYGHSHLSSLLILVLPISYWLYLERKEKKYLFLVIFFALNLFSTFGRVAIVLMCFQFLSVFFYKGKILISKKLKLSFLLLSLFFLIAVIFSFIIKKDSSFCRSDFSYADKVCKPFTADSRKFYWQQAFQSFRDNWVLGSGLGTFSIVSTKYRQIPGYYSAQVHNMFLEQFVSTGVLGGIIYLTFFVILFISTKPSKKDLENFNFKACLFLALFSSSIEAFFDFNWELNSIFFIVITYAAFLLRNDENKIEFLDNFFKKFKIKLNNVYQVFFYTLLSVLFLYLTVDLCLVLGKDDLAFEVFPYFNNHRLIFSGSEELSSDQQQKLDLIYKNNSAYLLEKLNGDSSYETKIKYFNYLYEVDPWQMTNLDLVAEHFVNNDFQSAQEALLKTDDFLDFRKKRYGFYKESLSFSLKERLANYFLIFARENHEQKNYLLEADFIARAYYYDDWSISKPQDWMFEDLKELSVSEKIKFLEKICYIPIKYWGDNRLNYASFLVSVLEDLSDKDILFLANSLSKNYPDYLERDESIFLIGIYQKAILIEEDDFLVEQYKQQLKKLNEF